MPDDLNREFHASFILDAPDLLIEAKERWLGLSPGQRSGRMEYAITGNGGRAISNLPTYLLLGFSPQEIVSLEHTPIEPGFWSLLVLPKVNFKKICKLASTFNLNVKGLKSGRPRDFKGDPYFVNVRRTEGQFKVEGIGPDGLLTGREKVLLAIAVYLAMDGVLKIDPKKDIPFVGFSHPRIVS